MLLVVWRFRARMGGEAAFEHAYGPDGEWARLFRRDPAYRGTDLLRPDVAEGWYLTIDRWASRTAYDAFRESHASEYHRVDLACEELTEAEELVGFYS